MKTFSLPPRGNCETGYWIENSSGLSDFNELFLTMALLKRSSSLCSQKTWGVPCSSSNSILAGLKLILRNRRERHKVCRQISPKRTQRRRSLFDMETFSEWNERIYFEAQKLSPQLTLSRSPLRAHMRILKSHGFTTMAKDGISIAKV